MTILLDASTSTHPGLSELTIEVRMMGAGFVLNGTFR